MSTLRLGSENLATDGVNGRVGIGTDSPSEKLEVSGGNSKLGDGGYNTGHIVMGNYHLWIDGNGKLRMKNGMPLGADDGSIIGP